MLLAALVVAGIAFPLWILARLQLGSAFSFRARADRLVTTGLYARLRHPVYVFGSIAGLAAVAALQVWWVLAVSVLLEGITVMRAIREDQLLLSVFGEEYQRYRKHTWF